MQDHEEACRLLAGRQADEGDWRANARERDEAKRNRACTANVGRLRMWSQARSELAADRQTRTADVGRKQTGRYWKMSKEDFTELMDWSKVKQLLNKSRKEVVIVKENNGCVWKKILGVVLVLAAIAGIAYAIYRYLNPKYEDEFLDDFDDDDDAFEDDLEDLKDDAADVVEDVKNVAEDIKDAAADKMFEDEKSGEEA